ncbi:putative inorganic phosphate cotransporter isoform X2 [Photinus pyralis]|uniref:putative inorganic phosphate cotransporter isoform X2 n=1 Tax=Photinus pyralis TaxID=7054 RepID=UPI001267305A|nr:putative inorganic phosphate cotransporter isoform X2 [Photinus pyralis]XP_031353945.1 putative inorganic phosphate cotransporter isoform X2 [Photinus pyralis]
MANEQSYLETKAKNPPVLRKRYGTRHTQAVLLFLITAIEFGTRINLPVAIVAMTTTNSTSNPDVPTYIWSWADHSVVLSSYYWGYVPPGLIAGHLVARFGAKWFLALSGLGGALCAILIPVLAPFGSWTVMLCRLGQGVCHGLLCPCCHSMLAKWVPKCERARLSAFVYGGGSLGMVLSFALSGWMCGSWLGWPLSFYAHGLVGLIWSMVWIFVGKGSPAEHKGISGEERMYIEASIGTGEPIQVTSTPWSSIFKSFPMWAILIGSFGQVWVLTTLMTNIPTYIANVLRFQIEENGLISGGPFLLFWICSFVWSYLIDFIITRRAVSTGTARKIATGVSLYTPGIGLLVIGLISGLNVDVTITTLVIMFVSVGISSGFLSGLQVNHIDLSPIHASTLVGLTNGAANILSIVAPLIVHLIVVEATNPAQWAVLFYIASAICVTCTTFYVVFASGEIQSWNGHQIDCISTQKEQARILDEAVGLEDVQLMT